MVIKSISCSQEQIIKDIMELHMDEDYFDLDPTYSKGVFYKNLKQPKFKSDLFPQVEGVVEASSTNLHYLEDTSIKSIMFDPPFVIGGKTSTGVIMNRFSSFETVSDLFNMYKDSLKEFHRTLKDGGICVFKCQDTVSSGKQYLTHNKVINMAEEIGFYPKDLFILEAKSRLLDPRIKNQYHARKFHSYFIVFKKQAMPKGFSYIN